jgi:hypothetical protein
MIGVVTRVTEARIPNIMTGGGRGKGTGRRMLERIKFSHTIAPKKLTPGKKALHRKTKRVKIYGTIIISSELTSGDKILNHARCNKNIDITKMKWTIRLKKEGREACLEKVMGSESFLQQ